MNNKLYDVLKQIALVWLPAVGALYFALSGIWGLPYAREVVGTITAVDTFLGAILGISTASYKKGIKEGQEGLKNANLEEFFSVTEKERQEALKQEDEA